MFDYNTSREHLNLREFGRNVQKIANHLLTIQDKEKRSRYATALVELMRQVGPTVKDIPEDNQRVWDDLHIMTNFQLDVDSPFDKPEATLQTKKPQKVAYHTHRINFKHYGHNLNLMVGEASKITDPAQRESAIIHIGKLMKSYHITWNKEIADDDIIIKNIEILSKGELTIDTKKVKAGSLFEPLYKEKIVPNASSTNKRFKKNNGSKSQNRRRKT